MKILIGADPEVFMQNNNSGEWISAHGRIPGTKAQPHPVARGAVQVDGMALEFNIDPAESCGEFIQNIKEVYRTLKGMVPGYNVIAEPVAMFSPEYFDQQPDDAKELGCSPDFNAWTGKENEMPELQGALKFMRTAAGHIHLGWTQDKHPADKSHFEDCRAVVKQLDYYLGLNSLLWDTDDQRRSLYGKAGAFRPKSYGCEYRVLSNVWLNSEPLQRWIYKCTLKALEDLQKGDALFKQSKYGDIAQTLIDIGDRDWPMMTNIKIPFPSPPLFKKAA